MKSPLTIVTHVLCLYSFFLPSLTRGDVVVVGVQVDSDVVFTASGTLDLTGLTFVGPGTAIAIVRPQDGALRLGENPLTLEAIDAYTGFNTFDESFGPGGKKLTDLGSGPRFGFECFDPVGMILLVPQGFTGGEINSSSTVFGESLSSLGITPGTYCYTWGQGANADSITFIIEPPLLGDVNLDSVVNLLDVDFFVDRLSTGNYQAEADCNEDGAVNLLDIDPFIEILGGG